MSKNLQNQANLNSISARYKHSNDAGFCNKPTKTIISRLQPFVPVKMSPRSDKSATQ